MSAKKGKFVELVEAQVVLEEAQDGKKRRIKIEGAIAADVVNGNKRRYPSPVIEAAVAELRDHLNESAGQGRAVQVLGEAEHPSDKGGRPNLLETVVKWQDVTFDGSRVDVVGNILETSKGKDILTLMEGGVMPGVSLRGYGDGEKKSGVFEVSELHITGFDLVLEPSFANAAQLIESKNQEGDETPEEKNIMSDELAKKIEETAKENVDLNKKLEEATRKAAEADVLKAQIEETNRQAEIAKAIEEACKEPKLGDKLNTVFVEAMKNSEFKSVEDVKKFAEAKRKEYGKLAADGVLAGMGFDEKRGGIVVIGDVLENETGTPEFARGAFEIGESIRRTELRPMRDLRKAETSAEIFTKHVLARFDKLYGAQLLAESKLLQEASITSDLNLPYSVSRAIYEEAFPSLVASGIFDVGVIDTNPTRLYFESFTGESGYTATITNEDLVAVEDTWVSLVHGRLTPDTVVVTSNGGGTTYVEGTDYIVDYAAGRIKVIGSALDGDTLDVDYSYTAIRDGEMNPIQRGKLTMAFKVVEAAADRIADQISREAVVFSRSQLGLDLVGATMASLVRQVRRKIDQGLLYWAYSAVKGVANNATAAWTVDNTQASLAELVELMGQAKVKVANRYYNPTFYLMSVTNADRLSNWEGYKRDGFPTALLGAAGFAGSVKGLPIFASTEFPDSLIICGNRELVMHRVYQPMTIQGPFPSYDSNGKLIAANQYYAEEFNVTESPIYEKGAFVPVTEDGGSGS